MCGLCAYAPNRKGEIDILKFKSLLLYNEDRGKISTGIYSKEGVIKDTVKASEFSQKQNWNNLNKNFVFIGHTRQPTLGYPGTMQGAQPIEHGNIVFTHNGSIYNKSVLATKYNVEESDGDTDSIIMAKILETRQFEVLNDYNGAAALIWVYKDEPNNLYYYKGASKNMDYSKVYTVERPLFSMMTKEGIYFSSIEDSLRSVSLSPEQIESITNIQHNKVFKLNINKIHKPLVIFETTAERQQTKIIIPKKKEKKRNTWRDDKTRKSNTPGRQSALPLNNKDIDDYEETSPGVYRKTNNAADIAERKWLHRNKIVTKLIVEDDHNHKKVFNSTTYTNIEDEEINNNMLSINMVYYNKGRYWLNGHIVNGLFMINPSGTITKEGDQYAFIDGVLLRNKAKKHYTTILETIRTKEYTFGEVSFAKFLSRQSEQPVPYYSFHKEGVMFMWNGQTTWSGRYKPLFLTRGNYEYLDGEFIYLISKEVNIGDAVSTKYKEDVIVTDLAATGFYGYNITDSNKRIEFFHSSWVLCVKTKIEREAEDLLSDADKKEIEEVSEIQDIALELVNDLNDAIYKLRLYNNNANADGLVSLISDFKQNKLAM